MGTFEEAIVKVARSMQLLTAKLQGYPLRGSRWVNRGEAVIVDKTIVMHPLDVIRAEHEGDPLGELDAVAAYFEDVTHWDLDDLTDFVVGAVNEVTARLVAVADRQLEASWVLWWGDDGKRLIRHQNETVVEAMRADRWDAQAALVAAHYTDRPDRG